MLSRIDLSKSFEKDEYRELLFPLQLKLRELAYQLYVERRSLVIVYEGWDASGKGGNIRRVTEKLDPRGYQVYSIAAPDGEDRTHHYLWRFWRRLKPPDEKQVVIFDRSWYGRVLVERVEGFATEDEWKRAYREINEFERQLVAAGALIAKFWIHISLEEQLRRFEARGDIAYKRWKLTDEDWRNREKRNLYEAAVEEMLVKTSTTSALWTIVEGNSKLYARIRALRHLVDLLSTGLDFDKPAKKKGEPKAEKKRKSAAASATKKKAAAAAGAGKSEKGKGKKKR